MELNSYKSTWDHRVNSLETGAIAVDGSTSEKTLVSNGQWTASQVKAALSINQQDTVLELGCGVGRIGKELAPQCKHWIGVDISKNMVECAQQRLQTLNNVSLHELPGNNLSVLSDSSVDKAYSIAVFCHLDKEDLFNYLRELKRVVKPGGIIFVETWNLCHPIGWKRWQYEADSWQTMDQTQRKDVARNQFCTPQEFALYIEKAGFDVIRDYSDSVWIQAVAGNQLDQQHRSELENILDKQQSDFVYSKTFSTLFEKTMQVSFNEITPQDMMDYIDQLGDTPEAELYRRYLIGLWKNNETSWGKCPH
ncbi:MAG: class I SAM-dependent methyltransferase [Gammaproteobacteria bacterium]|nr:class I SAM-dependent methyltransferase [Gammaproteobacteria bacterium]